MSESIIDPGFLLLLQDMDQLIAGKISPAEFETKFFGNKELRLQMKDGRKFGYETYQNLFYVVEDYVADPVLRTDPEDLGDDDLRSAVTVARSQFSDYLKSFGCDTYGRPFPHS